MRDPRVQAIRGNPEVGNQTMSIVEMTFTDDEIYDDLTSQNILTEEEAIEWAKEIERLHREQSLNCRWGEDNDPELQYLDP